MSDKKPKNKKCLTCGKAIQPSARSVRKKYCDEYCRYRFHNAMRRTALQQMRDHEQQEA